MKEIELKYGCNPNQKPARIYMEDGSELPVEVLNGRPRSGQGRHRRADQGGGPLRSPRRYVRTRVR